MNANERTLVRPVGRSAGLREVNERKEKQSQVCNSVGRVSDSVTRQLVCYGAQKRRLTRPTF